MEQRTIHQCKGCGHIQISRSNVKYLRCSRCYSARFRIIQIIEGEF